MATRQVATLFHARSIRARFSNLRDDDMTDEESDPDYAAHLRYLARVKKEKEDKKAQAESERTAHDKEMFLLRSQQRMPYTVLAKKFGVSSTTAKEAVIRGAGEKMVKLVAAFRELDHAPRGTRTHEEWCDAFEALNQYQREVGIAWYSKSDLRIASQRLRGIGPLRWGGRAVTKEYLQHLIETEERWTPRIG